MSFWNKMRTVVVFLFGLVSLALAFELGTADAVIYYGGKNKELAEEFSGYLERIFSRRYPVKPHATENASSSGLFVGVVPEGFPMAQEEESGREFCVMEVRSEQLYLFGSEKFKQCTTFAVYDFLEKFCGVRWLWPGESGTVVEPRQPVSFPEGRTLIRPGFDLRLTNSFHYGAKMRSLTSRKELASWMQHMKVGASFGLNVGHSFRAWMPQSEFGEEHPEYFSLVSPEHWVGLVKPKEPTRTWDGSIETCTQLCTSNPEVRRIIAERVAQRAAETGKMQSVSPNDGFGFCECEQCRKQDGDQKMYGDKHFLTNRMYDFLNDVATQVQKLNPKAKVGMFSYSWFSGVPDNITKLPSNVYLSLCYVSEDHYDPKMEKATNERILGLGKLGARLVGREYWGTHNTLELPLLNSRKIAENLKLLHSVNAAGIYGETGTSFAARASDLYILARMAWNPTLDREQLLQDFCDKGFGDASKTMLQYFNFIEDRVATVKTAIANREPSEIQQHYPNGYAARHVGHLEIFTPEFLQEAKALLQLAKKQARNPEQKERVEFITYGHDFAEIMAECIRYRQLLAAAGVDMSLVQPSAEMVRMERSNLRSIVKGLIQAETNRGYFLLSVADRSAIDIGQFIYASQLHLRPWKALAEAADIELAANKFSYLVNGSFEYRGYNWDIKVSQGQAEHEFVSGKNCDERNNYMVVGHANQGISLQALLQPGAELSVTSLRPAIAEAKRGLSVSLWLLNEGDPLSCLDVQVNGKPLKASWLNREIVLPGEWNQIGCQRLEAEPGEYTLGFKLRNPGTQPLQVNVDNIRMVLE
jgi:hypothetical protein